MIVETAEDDHAPDIRTLKELRDAAGPPEGRRRTAG